MSDLDLDKKFNLVDEKTPLNESLRAHYKKSLAFYTLHLRLPIILTEVIDSCTRNKDTIQEDFGESSREELKTAIGKISQLKYELQTNKTLNRFDPEDLSVDLKAWNDFLETLSEPDRTYFSSKWLWSECYLYRQLKFIFQESVSLRDFDYFGEQKNKSYWHALESMKAVAKYLRTNLNGKGEDQDYFGRIFKLNLWGNRCDLSVSAGKQVDAAADPFSAVESLESFVLIDQTSEIFACLKSGVENHVEMINDNAGYELFADLVLADYLIERKLAKRITFNLKAMPWFISDALRHDLDFLLENLSNSSNEDLATLSERWKCRLQKGEFTVKCSDFFWTLPYDFAPMQKVDPELYKRLSQARLLIFKGDLNYRKLMGDINHPPTISFKDALRGFLPTNLCSLRTVKADVISGLSAGKSEELYAKDNDWMRTGDYGVIQFVRLDAKE